MDKWLAIGVTTGQAGLLRLIEDACRDAGDYGFFSRVRDELAAGADVKDILKRYEVTIKNEGGTGMRTKNLKLLYSVTMDGVTGDWPYVIIEVNTHGGIDKVTVEMAGRKYPAYLMSGEEVENEVDK